MKRVFAVMAASVLAGSSLSYGQSACDGSPDPYDYNLCVYTTTAADAQYSSTDGQISAFWSDWGSKDYVEMIPPGSCYPGRCNFTDASDAAITIKAAGTGRGLYILAIATDNTWVDRNGAGDWGADACDFYFDAKDANTVYTCTDCRIGGYCGECSYTTQQFQTWMGNSALPTGCKYQYYDNDLWSHQELYVEFSAMKVLYGMEVEVVSLGPNQKAQEWFFPWEKYGQGENLEVGTELGGKMVGFSGGYNDKDGDNPDPDCLRWLLGDPWGSDVNYWGNFVLQSDMGQVQSVVKAKEPAVKAVGSVSRKASTAFFTLQGQKVTAPLSTLPKGMVVVQRSTMTDGSVRSNVMTIGR